MLPLCCGRNCEKCAVYVANVADDNGKRVALSNLWTRSYKRPIKSGSVICKGCQTEEGKAAFCAYMNEIGKCCKNKAVSDCAKCSSNKCSYLKWSVGRRIPYKKPSDGTGLSTAS